MNCLDFTAVAKIVCNYLSGRNFSDAEYCISDIGDAHRYRLRYLENTELSVSLVQASCLLLSLFQRVDDLVSNLLYLIGGRFEKVFNFHT